MIFRKPYALLIKNFRLIHIVITALMIFVVSQFTYLNDFFSVYSNKGWSIAISKINSEAITVFIYLSLILIILASLIIYILFKEKEKPNLIYLTIMIFYLLLIGITFIANSQIDSLKTMEIDQRVVMAYRDITNMARILQYIYIVLMAIRGFGFDIKKFNFSKDLQDLSIELSDNEEVEFIVGFDGEKATSKIRKQGRELKYYFLENKIVLTLLVGVIAFVSIFSMYIYFEVINKQYPQGQYIRVNNLTMMVKDSFLTNESYRNKIVAAKDDIYLVVNMLITNDDVVVRNINSQGFTLYVGEDFYKPEKTNINWFKDFGIPLESESIDVNKTKSIAIIYKIPENNLKKKMKLEYLYSLSFKKDGGYATKFKTFQLKPINVDEEELVKSNQLTEVLNFNGSMIGNTKVRINTYEINDKFEYSYEFCTESSCKEIKDSVFAAKYGNYSKTILKINGVFENESNLEFTNMFDFLNTFMHLSYTIKGQKITQTIAINDKTPAYQKGVIYLEVLDDIEKAEKINLEFIIRDKKYIYVLK